MKTLILSIFTFISVSLQAQSASVKTETFVVKGNCEECKERIENAADIKGVKILDWNVDSKIATATYDSEKTSITKIQQAIASKGYDAGEFKGSDRAYKKLPGCCKYRDGKCEEEK